MNIKIKKLHPEAIIPKYATDGAACFDIHSITECCTQEPQAILETGLAFEIPEDHVMLLFSRSGHAFKQDIRLANAVGVLDSDYVGQVMVKLTCDTNAGIKVSKGERIAQAMIIPVQQVSFEVVEELKSTERGEGGFGSTGLH